MKLTAALGIAVIALGCSEPQARTARSTAEGVEPSDPTPARGRPVEEPTAETDEAQAPRARALVKLIVLGDFDEDMLDEVEAGLRDVLAVDVERIEGVPLPQEAWYPPRRRYRADRILDFLRGHLDSEPETTRVLGLTAVDISTTKGRHEDWGVFGLGDLGGRACVISSYRLSERGRRHDELVTFRVVTTAVHEVGHTLGLTHCDDPRCVMRDAEGSIRTVDTSDGRLGPICRERIEQTAPRVDLGT
jgi:archaemetzincin